jgi:Rrf2 family protein
MKFNKMTRHSLLVIGYIAAHQKDGKVEAEAISIAYDVPVYSLQKMLQRLVRTGLLVSKTGPHGGYVLAKEADKITLLEIIDAAKGFPSDAIDIVEQTQNEHFALRMREVINVATAAENKVFEKTTLADVIGGLRER